MGKKCCTFFKERVNLKHIKKGGTYIMKWSRKWEEFDFNEVDARIREGKEPGITQEEYIEYLQWLRVTHPDESLKLSIYAILVEQYGFSEEEAAYWASRPEKIEECINKYFNSL